MEKKTTRRIIGVLVVIALVIVLLPLLTNNSENPYPLQTSEVKAPPFPGSDSEAVIPVATTVAAATPAPVATSATSTTTVATNSTTRIPPGHLGNSPTSTTTVTHTVTNASPSKFEPVTEAMNDDDLGIENVKLNTPDLTTRAINETENIVAIDSDGDNQQSVNKPVSSIADANKVKSQSPVTKPVVVADATPAKPKAVVPNTPVVQVMSASARPHARVATKAHAKTPAPASVGAPVMKKAPFDTVAEDFSSTAPTTTISMKKSAWMVQLGIFKNKMNAERLTNMLRAKGYKAFTLQTKSGAQTRVCVGPESQQTSANALASRIAEDTNMHGIVLAYKPLEI